MLVKVIKANIRVGGLVVSYFCTEFYELMMDWPYLIPLEIKFDALELF